MKVEKIAVYFPNGQAMMVLEHMEGTVEEISQIASAGLNDIISKMPDLTRNAKDMLTEYEKAKAAGISLSSSK